MPFLLVLLITLAACQSAAEAANTPVAEVVQATEIPPTETAVPTQPPSPTSRSVPAPPTGTVLVDDTGPTLADLPEGWTKVTPGGDTRCAHNTDYAYYVKPGTINKLLLYFEGGGGCWDAASCAVGSSFYDADVGGDEDPSRRGGVFELSHPDNPFREYTAVYIPACNGDVHWGNTVQEYASPDGGDDGRTLTIYHRGFVNAAAALDWAYSNVSNPDSVFVTGCSAGSSYTFAQYNTEKDNVQVRFYQAAGGGDAANFAADLAAHLSSIHAAAPNFRSYTPSGDLHCILPRPQFYTTEVDGLKLTDWVQALADGKPVTSVKCETCQNETER